MKELTFLAIGLVVGSLLTRQAIDRATLAAALRAAQQGDSRAKA
ncbi:hypothetical protein [Pseudomonas xantholysinigenes]|nr:hypothetical protein [Pseudomonas xantholysinigenes]